jgi:hypothetical protein
MTDHAAAVCDDGFDLRHAVQTTLPPTLPKLGHKGKVRPELNLADYVHADAPAVPKAVHRSHLDHDFPMYLNDRLGICGEAMALHGIEALHLDAHTPVPPFSDADAEKLYEEVGGYVPGEPETDQGTDNHILVTKWQDDGVLCSADGSVHKIVGSLFVDPHDVALNQRAIWEFVVLYRAIALPITAQGQREWHVTDDKLEGDAEPGSWGGHDIPYLSYDGHLFRCETWGTSLLVTYGFDKAYSMEGFVVVTEEMMDLRGMSPAGFDWDKLTSDFKALVS